MNVQVYSHFVPKPNRPQVNLLCSLKGDPVRTQYYLYKKPTQRQSKVMTI